ncbi:MAG: hypothetical protein GX880_04010 [Methanomicrobiales archaeon]|nr:hypothetical protein [Methanomicrobiales archaeon]
MTADRADEVMAEYLLKGGKMLAKSCKVCGYPLFEYKGETLCVICPLEEAEESAPEPAPVAQPPIESPEPAATGSRDRVAVEIEQTIIHLCERIRHEQSADECLTLMMAVERGAEALQTLRQR